MVQIVINLIQSKYKLLHSSRAFNYNRHAIHFAEKVVFVSVSVHCFRSWDFNAQLTLNVSFIVRTAMS